MTQVRSPKWGDHIRVRRCFYWHHGIYIADDRVVQFGNGIRDKRISTVEVTNLAGFAKGGRIDIVVHSENASYFSGAVGPPDYRADIVHRANWLVANHPPGRYNLIGWNCEHLATFCVNGYRESSQVRRILAFMGFTALPLIGAVAFTRKNSGRVRKYVWVWGVLAVGLMRTYRTYSLRVWVADLERQWMRDHPSPDTT